MKTRAKHARPRTSERQPLMSAKAQFALEAARSRKLLEGERTRVLSARLTEQLVAAAKQRTGVASDTQLIELALASLAVGDDFGEWLVTQGGRLKSDFAIDL